MDKEYTEHRSAIENKAKVTSMLNVIYKHFREIDNFSFFERESVLYFKAILPGKEGEKGAYALQISNGYSKYFAWTDSVLVVKSIKITISQVVTHINPLGFSTYKSARYFNFKELDLGDWFTAAGNDLFIKIGINHAWRANINQVRELSPLEYCCTDVDVHLEYNP